MANVNAPNGLAPVRFLSGAPWNQQANLYVIPAADTGIWGIGDIVISAVGGDVNGVPNIAKAIAASVPRGILVGIDPVLTAGTSLVGTSLSLETIQIPSVKAHDYYVYVVDDPNVIFEIQGDNATVTTAIATMSQNALPTIANPAAGSPFSATVLATASLATTNTHMLKILGLTRKPGADFTAYTRYLCMFNTHELRGLSTAPA